MNIESVGADRPELTFTYPGIFILATVLVWLAYDIYLYMSDDPKEPTLSKVIRDYGQRYPQIVFLVGFLCGHFFW